MKEIHYLTPEEERAIKRNVPYGRLDTDIVEVVRLANSVKGIATVQSCAGHYRRKGTTEEFDVRAASVVIRANEEMTNKILFEFAPRFRITDIQIRYFTEGTFWLNLLVEPTEKHKLIALFEELGKA